MVYARLCCGGSPAGYLWLRSVYADYRGYMHACSAQWEQRGSSLLDFVGSILEKFGES
jgi:hypothetical protein